MLSLLFFIALHTILYFYSRHLINGLNKEMLKKFNDNNENFWTIYKNYESVIFYNFTTGKADYVTVDESRKKIKFLNKDPLLELQDGQPIVYEPYKTIASQKGVLEIKNDSSSIKFYSPNNNILYPSINRKRPSIVVKWREKILCKYKKPNVAFKLTYNEYLHEIKMFHLQEFNSIEKNKTMEDVYGVCDENGKFKTIVLK
ncbi:hypothetical protein CCFV1_ORF025 [Cotesia congregata filamentous virus 1]|uniref:Uncharacterized protein n=1 Tax=Cotesia congregata filamentous virus 1 TaxID=3064291 RepID=A0ABC8QK35_9VIRU|nr:hypothetical protein CCFV1_ORF025 [Cotesia congregata filamentous virus 1]